MLMRKLVELISKGTSGLSKARVQSATATCIAEDNVETEEMRTYVIDASDLRRDECSGKLVRSSDEYDGYDGS